jgi:hypothetical protein
MDAHRDGPQTCRCLVQGSPPRLYTSGSTFEGAPTPIALVMGTNPSPNVSESMLSKIMWYQPPTKPPVTVHKLESEVDIIWNPWPGAQPPQPRKACALLKFKDNTTKTYPYPPVVTMSAGWVTSTKKVSSCSVLLECFACPTVT